MSQFELFMKGNKRKRENVKYAPTKSLCDESGKPLEFEFKHLTTAENEEIQANHTREVQVTGKPGMYRPKFNSQGYLKELIVQSIVYPNLYSEELQDSYGVTTPEKLLMELVDSPGEYAELADFVQKMQGFKPVTELVEEAKN